MLGPRILIAYDVETSFSAARRDINKVYLLRCPYLCAVFLGVSAQH